MRRHVLRMTHDVPRLFDLKHAALAITRSSRIDYGTHGAGDLAFTPDHFAFVFGVNAQFYADHVVGAVFAHAHGFRFVYQVFGEVLD
jgi:hypothetical protein